MLDSKRIKYYQRQISILNKKINKIKTDCNHSEGYSYTLIESFQYLYTPVKECKVCGHSDKNISDFKKKQLIKEHFDFYGITYTPEDLEKYKNGFNEEDFL